MHIDEQHLWKYLDGELPASEAEAVAAAAAKDEEVRRTLEELRIIQAEILAGAPRPPEGFAARVAAQARWRTGAAAFDAEAARALLKRFLVAAAVLAAVGLAYLAVEVAPRFFEPVQAAPLFPR